MSRRGAGVIFCLAGTGMIIFLNLLALRVWRGDWASAIAEALNISPILSILGIGLLLLGLWYLYQAERKG